MENSVTYIIQSHLVLVLFYIVYRLLLARQPWFQANRFVLLALPLLALVVPFFDINLPNGEFTRTLSIELPAITVQQAGTNNSLDWLPSLASFYFSGVIVLMVVFIFRLLRVSLMQRGETENGYRIIETPGGSFSFFKAIYLNKDLDDDTREMVLKHEQVHADQWHSADTIWYELLSAVFWFNPVIWMMKKELRDTHEFIADRAISKTYRKEDYLNALLRATFNTKTMHFLPMFNHSQTLIKRVKMMKIKQLKIQRIRYALALPLVAAIVFAAACTEQNEVTPTEAGGLNEPATGQLDEPLLVAEQMPEFPGGQNELFAYLGNNLKYPETAKSEGLEGRVVVSFIIEKDGSIGDVEVLKGIGGGCDEEAVRVVSNMPNWAPGVQAGEKVRVNYKLPIQFALSED